MNTENEIALNNEENSSKKNGIFKSIHTDELYRKKFIITLWCAWAYAIDGWQAAQIGTALPELQRILHVDFETVSWIFTCYNIGTIVSGLSFGFLYDRFNQFAVMAICLVSVGILHGIIPISTSFPATLVLRVCIGICIGGIETGMTTIVSSVWDTDGAAFIQAMYLSFFIGGFIGPLVTNPFMSDCQIGQHNTTEDRITKHVTQNNLQETARIIQYIPVTTVSSTVEVNNVSCIVLAFLITGIASLISAIPFIYMVKSNKYRNIKACTKILLLEREQSQTATSNKTDSVDRNDSKIKCYQAKEMYVDGTIKPLLEINNDRKQTTSDNLNVASNFKKIEKFPKTLNEVAENIFIITEDRHLLNRNEETDIASFRTPSFDLNEITLEKMTVAEQTLPDHSSRLAMKNEHVGKDYKRFGLTNSTRQTVNKFTDKKHSEEINMNTSTEFRLYGKEKIYVILLVDILFVCFYSRGYAVYNFLPTFCLEYLNWTVVSSSMIISVFSIAAVVGGIFSIFLARIFNSTKLAFTGLFSWNIATLSGYVAAAYRVDWLIWFSVILQGAVVVMEVAASVSWLQHNVCSITGRISASFVVAGGIGITMTPNIMGFLMQNETMMFYCYSHVGFSFISLIAFSIAFLIQQISISKYTL